MSRGISIHAPRTGSDGTDDGTCQLPDRFQSTLPARGATCRDCRGKRRGGYFNPRSPHGERHWKKSARNRQNHFNPRSPHGERPGWCALAILPRYFNPRSPHGERQEVNIYGAVYQHFNPRSPHGERQHVSIHMGASGNFNPRSPHGERRRADSRKRCFARFQSTLPARGATRMSMSKTLHLMISIHAPRTGSDWRGAVCNNILCRYFNPRSPHGERPV